MIVNFHSNQLGLGGTEVALYDYANYNEKILNNKSFITAPLNAIANNKDIINKFKNRFSVFLYEDFKQVESYLDKNSIDVFYAIKAGEYDNIISRGRKSVMHIVFGQICEPHGDVYAYVSEWLAKQICNGIYPWVPHMITLPENDENLRNKLNIPNNSIVFGRYGGLYAFDISFVVNAIQKILNKRNDIYFLFANTEKFYEHPNIIYYNIISDDIEKVKFINTCDAMLHARWRGETFGLACGEFSIKNKPIFTYGLSPERCHLDILKDKAFIYNNEEELFEHLNNFFPDSNKNWDAYSDKYNPEIVIKKFNEVFLNV